MVTLRARGRCAGCVATAVAVLTLVACASAPRQGVTHVVRPGENIYRIARYYQVSQRDVVRANRVRDVTQVAIGTHLWIPGARRAPSSKVLAAPAAAVARAAAAQRVTDVDFAWPVRGRVSSGFGTRRGRAHDGIDIPARRGTPIRAAEAGRVIHSGSDLGDYGRVVILKHAGPYKTVYAHNRRNHVRKGEFVEKGEVIAEVGASGNARGPHIHFEVRNGQNPLNPLLFLE